MSLSLIPNFLLLTCLTGCGAVCFSEFFHRDFPYFLLTQERHINELELLTVVVSVSSLTLSVPAFCVAELQLELNVWLTKCSFTKRELQQLLGKLSYVSACVRPGRAFMSRLLNALRLCFSAPRQTVHPVSDDLRADINW